MRCRNARAQALGHMVKETPNREPREYSGNNIGLGRILAPWQAYSHHISTIFLRFPVCGSHYSPSHGSVQKRGPKCTPQYTMILILYHGDSLNGIPPDLWKPFREILRDPDKQSAGFGGLEFRGFLGLNLMRMLTFGFMGLGLVFSMRSSIGIVVEALKIARTFYRNHLFGAIL